MLLNEQIYRNLNRKYYHGSLSYPLDKSFARYKYFFMTTRFTYALGYAVDLGNDDFGYVYQLKLKQSANIFNIHHRFDRKKLEQCLNDNSEKELLVYLPKILDGQDLLDSVKSIKPYHVELRNHLFDIMVGLGYDGFFNKEFTNPDKVMFWKLNDNPCIGLLNADSVIIEKVYHDNDLTSHPEFLKQKEDDLENLKENIYIAMKNGNSKKNIIEELFMERNNSEISDISELQKKNLPVGFSFVTFREKDIVGIIENFDFDEYEKEVLESDKQGLREVLLNDGYFINPMARFRRKYLWNQDGYKRYLETIRGPNGKAFLDADYERYKKFSD